MSDQPSDAPPSPYGPAPGSASTPTTSTPAWVERGRGVLRLAALITGVLSVVLSIVVIVLVALGAGPADNAIDGFARWLTDTLIFVAPASVVTALNLLIWRALLRPLGRMSVAGRVGTILAMVAVLAALSVVLVAVLLFAGFFAFGIVGNGF